MLIIDHDDVESVVSILLSIIHHLPHPRQPLAPSVWVMLLGHPAHGTRVLPSFDLAVMYLATGVVLADLRADCSRGLLFSLGLPPSPLMLRSTKLHQTRSWFYLALPPANMPRSSVCQPRASLRHPLDLGFVVAADHYDRGRALARPPVVRGRGRRPSGACSRRPGYDGHGSWLLARTS